MRKKMLIFFLSSVVFPLLLLLSHIASLAKISGHQKSRHFFLFVVNREPSRFGHCVDRRRLFVRWLSNVDDRADEQSAYIPSSSSFF